MVASRRCILEGKLKDPLQFQTICKILAAVDQICTLSLATEGTDEGDFVTLCAVNSKHAYQIWAHLEVSLTFKEFQLNEDACVDFSSGSVKDGLRSYNGINEVELRVDAMPANMCHIVLKTESTGFEGPSDLTVKQKLFGRRREFAEVPLEPDVGDLDVYCQLDAKILDQINRACDHFRNMSPLVKVRVSKVDEIFTLVSEPALATITVSWPGPVTIPVSDASQSQTQTALTQYNITETNELNEEVHVTVSIKDWLNVLEMRNVVRKIIVGLGSERVLVAYGYPQYSSQDHRLVHYLSQVS